MEAQLEGKKLAYLLLAFLGLFLLDYILGQVIGGYVPGWLLGVGLGRVSILFSLYLIVRCNRIEFKKILIAYGLCFLVMLREASLDMGVMTLVNFMAAKSVFERSETKLWVVKERCLKGLISSMIIGLVMGSFIGAIDLGLRGEHFYFNLQYFKETFIAALRPGIWEEVSFRYFVVAVCVFICGGKLKNKRTYGLMFLLMLLPHVLLHFPEVLIYGNTSLVVLQFLKLVFLFGIPLTIVLLKRDLTTAMSLHFALDLIIFWNRLS